MDEGRVWPTLKIRGELGFRKNITERSIFRLRQTTQVIGI